MDNLNEDLENQIPIIKVHRKGITDNAYMVCEKIIKVIRKEIKYKITNNDLIETNLELTQKKIENIKRPKGLLIFTANIVDTISNQDQSYNIFGKNNFLILEDDNLDIPVIESTSENFAYFGSKLHKIEDIIEMDTPPIFLTNTSVGTDYMNGYILQKNYGKGFFIEKHKNYHYHQPLNEECNGYYVLAKQIENSTFEIGALKIPYGYSVITPSGVLHTDCSLIGSYLVGYSISKEFLTLNMYNKKSNIVKITFKK